MRGVTDFLKIGHNILKMISECRTLPQIMLIDLGAPQGKDSPHGHFLTHLIMTSFVCQSSVPRCKAIMQYLLNCEVSRYSFLALYCRVLYNEYPHKHDTFIKCWCDNGQRLRRWTGITPTLGQCHVLSV